VSCAQNASRWGEGPRQRLCEPDEAQIAREGEASRSHPSVACCLVHQPTYGIVRQHPAVEFLAHPLGGLASKAATALNEVRFKLIKHRFDLPALMVNGGQLDRGRGVRIEQARDQSERLAGAARFLPATLLPVLLPRSLPPSAESGTLYSITRTVMPLVRFL
jgi:hypothetical protein